MIVVTEKIELVFVLHLLFVADYCAEHLHSDFSRLKVACFFCQWIMKARSSRKKKIPT